VCGGPVVPTEGAIVRSNAELPNLVRSHRARAMALGWVAAAFVLGAIAAMAAGVALLVWLASHPAAVILGVVALAAATLATVSLRRSRRRRGEARDELDQAWELVAGEVVRARRGDTTAPDLAKLLHTHVGHAEQLLAGLSAHGGARVDIRDDAELAYRIDDGATSEAGNDAEPSAEAPGPGRSAR
jgi:type IV secretory pathway TrbD component